MNGTNIAIVGKSGIGKSTLLNYLFGKEVAKTGTGEPVTKQGFHFFSDIIDGKKINIYDSWGIEPGKTDVWLHHLSNFLNDRKTLDIDNWIHTVVFCLSAEGKRIEDFEKNIFTTLKDEYLNPIIVITKSDLDKDKTFLEAVKKEFKTDQIVEICSISKKVGLGLNKRESEKVGKNNLIEVININSVKSLKNRFLLLSKKYLKDRKNYKLTYFRDNIDRIINNYDNDLNLIGNIKENTVKSILNSVDILIEEYDNESKNEVKNFSSKINESFSNLYFFNNFNVTAPKKINTEIDMNSSDFINSHSLFTKGQVGYFESMLWGGPIGPLAMVYIRNRGISKKDLILRIENEITK